MMRGALISNDGKYRYFLERRWSAERKPLCFIMLNPSTADDEQDDPTIRRCMGFARTLGYGGILVANLLNRRQTQPKKLMLALAEKRSEVWMTHRKELIGPEGDSHWSSFRGLDICCAWGTLGPRWRVLQVVDQLGDTKLYCLGTTKDGHPQHPLYLSKRLPLREWKVQP